MKKEKSIKPKVRSSKKSSTSKGTASLSTENSHSDDLETKRSMPREETIVSPDLPKAMLTVIRPTRIEKVDSISAKATDLVESVKDMTGEAIDTLASTAGLGVKRTTSELNSEPLVRNTVI